MGEDDVARCDVPGHDVPGAAVGFDVGKWRVLTSEVGKSGVFGDATWVEAVVAGAAVSAAYVFETLACRQWVEADPRRGDHRAFHRPVGKVLVPRCASAVRTLHEPLVGVQPDVGRSEEDRHHVGNGRVVHEPLQFW